MRAAIHVPHASMVYPTAHVVDDDSCFLDGPLPELPNERQPCLTDNFDVVHSIFQFEPANHGDLEQATDA